MQWTENNWLYFPVLILLTILGFVVGAVLATVTFRFVLAPVLDFVLRSTFLL